MLTRPVKNDKRRGLAARTSVAAILISACRVCRVAAAVPAVFFCAISHAGAAETQSVSAKALRAAVMDLANTFGDRYPDGKKFHSYDFQCR